MIAITGASGLLGQHLVERLTREGNRVTAVVRTNQLRFPEAVDLREADILDPLGLSKAISGATSVVHAAGMVSFNPRRREEIFAVNVEGTRNLVNACLQEGIRTVVHISSVAALGRKPGAPIQEEDPWTGMFVNDYARSKYLAELEAFRGGEEGLTVSVLNPSVILSGNPVHRSSGSLFDYVWKEKPFFTSGTMNYVDIRDVGDAVVKLLNAPQPGERFTLSAGNVPYLQFFKEVARRWNKRAPFIRIPTALVRMFGMAEELRGLLTGREPLVTRHSAAMAARDFRYDNTKARERLALAFRPLDETLNWCCTQYAESLTGTKDASKL